MMNPTFEIERAMAKHQQYFDAYLAAEVRKNAKARKFASIRAKAAAAELDRLVKQLKDKS